MADTPRVTVPVEDLAGKLKAIRDKFLIPTPDKDYTDYAIMTRCIDALTAAPVREEGGAVDDLRRLLCDAICYGCSRRYGDNSEAAIKDARGCVSCKAARSALATREEAPAEAGEALGAAKCIHAAAIIYEDQAHLDDAEVVLNHLRAQPQAREDAQLVWVDGVPSKHHAKEWFIAETTFGDRVVLTSLPEEYTYDFKTADEPYIKADRIKRWMPFPDSEYLFPHPAPDALRVAVEALEYVKQETADFAEAWEVAEVCDEKIAALQAEQKGGA